MWLECLAMYHGVIGFRGDMMELGKISGCSIPDLSIVSALDKLLFNAKKPLRNDAILYIFFIIIPLEGDGIYL